MLSWWFFTQLYSQYWCCPGGSVQGSTLSNRTGGSSFGFTLSTYILVVLHTALLSGLMSSRHHWQNRTYFWRTFYHTYWYITLSYLELALLAEFLKWKLGTDIRAASCPPVLVFRLRPFRLDLLFWTAWCHVMIGYLYRAPGESFLRLARVPQQSLEENTTRKRFIGRISPAQYTEPSSFIDFRDADVCWLYVCKLPLDLRTAILTSGYRRLFST